MSKLLICCESDLPSCNMKDRLLESGGWDAVGKDENHTFYSKGDDLLLSTSDVHIYTDDLDKVAEKFGFKSDVVIYMSKHSAASGEPALTVHPIGNYHENKFGGKVNTLVKAHPSIMTDALRRIVSYNTLPEFRTCFEVTHHGPCLKTPTMFIEIGSDEKNWGNIPASAILAKVVSDAEPNDDPSVIGIGGGHYAPRFTELVEKHRVNMGHMIPLYQTEDRDDEDILRMVADASAATDTKMVYMHRNSFGKPMQRHILEMLESEGYENVRSSDFEEINGN
jgi:D-aminoacyl-tRNA deacylase